MDTQKESNINEGTAKFLKIAYPRFYKLFDELIEDEFYENDPYFRLSRIRDIFSLYSEIVTCDIINSTITNMDSDKVLKLDLFKFVRNILAHFPFFDEWDEIWFKKELVTWQNRGSLSIDSFLSNNEGKGPKQFFLSIGDSPRVLANVNFPYNYTSNEVIFLKDILSEYVGLRLSLMLMKTVIDENFGKVSRYIVGIK